MAKPANMPPAMTARPYVFPRFNAAMAADLAADVEVEVAVVPPAPPKAPNPVVVAEPAEPVPAEPAEEVDEIVEVFTRVGSWAPQGWSVRQEDEQALLANPQAVTHWLAASVQM